VVVATKVVLFQLARANSISQIQWLDLRGHFETGKRGEWEGRDKEKK